MNLNFIGTVFFSLFLQRPCLSFFFRFGGCSNRPAKILSEEKKRQMNTEKKLTKEDKIFLPNNSQHFAKVLRQPLFSSPSTTLALRSIFYYVNRGTIRKLLYFITNGFEPSRLSFFPRRVHVYQQVEIFLSHALPSFSFEAICPELQLGRSLACLLMHSHVHEKTFLQTCLFTEN